jgi:hypothetical protein
VKAIESSAMIYYNVGQSQQHSDTQTGLDGQLLISRIIFYLIFLFLGRSFSPSSGWSEHLFFSSEERFLLSFPPHSIFFDVCAFDMLTGRTNKVLKTSGQQENGKEEK